MYQENLVKGIVYEKEEFTREEIDSFREEYLSYVGHLVDHFATDNSRHCSHPDREMTTRERLEMLAFCMLSAIDGESGSTRGFIMIPIVGEEEGYTLPDNIEKFDITGALHDNIYKYFK